MMHRMWMRSIFCLLALTLLHPRGGQSYELTDVDRAVLEKKIVARWEITTGNEVAEAYRRGIDILDDHPNPVGGYFPILVNAAQLVELEADGHKLIVDSYDWYAEFAAKSPQYFGGFQTHDEIVTDLLFKNLLNPSITELFSIGQSIEGREQYVLKISDNPTVDEDEPEVFLNALHHAREPIGPAVLLETANRLLSGYGTDTLITRLVNEREIFIMPMVNPDGYAYNEVIAPSGGGLWRRNRNPNDGVNFGVDPNRNYGYEWGYDDIGSSPDPASDVYRGAAPFSEPEIANMRAFTNSRNFPIVLNYHSWSDLYIWPWSFDFELYSADHVLFETLGNMMAASNGYLPFIGSNLYVTNGGANDWQYGASDEHTKCISYTVEVGGLADAPPGFFHCFWPEPDSIPSLIEENQAPNFLVIDLAANVESILPAAVPAWSAPDTADTGGFELTWTDPGSANPAVSYELRELFSPTPSSDDTESGDSHWDVQGFVISNTRAVSGANSYYSPPGLNQSMFLRAKNYLSVQPGDMVTMNLWYNMGANFDFFLVEVSPDDGHSWYSLDGNIAQSVSPPGKTPRYAITGTSGDWVVATYPLDDFAGQDVLVRLAYWANKYFLTEGIYIDDIYPVIDFDSTVVLASAATATTFAVNDKKTDGVYLYDLSATDADGQTSRRSAPHDVTVFTSLCPDNCACHGDPQCDSVTNVLDVVNTVNVAFKNGAPLVDPGCPYDRTDVSCDGVTNVIDVVKFVNVAFRNADAAVEFCDPCGP